MAANPTLLSEESPQSDGALVARLRDGDDAAFETLINDYSPHLWAVCKRFFTDDSDAADALQDAFLSAFRGIHNFDGQARLSTWLHRIAVNACLMKIRSRQRRPESSLDALLPTYKADGHNTRPVPAWRHFTPELAQQRETQQLVRQAIDNLPESYRIVLMLRDIEGLDTAAAAQVLEVSENVVKTRLHRARQALRTLLEPHFLGGAL